MRTVTSMNARTGGGDGRRGRAAAPRVFDRVFESGGGGARVSRAFDEETRVALSSASSIAHCFSANARRTARFSSSRLVSARASSRADSRSAARRRRAAAAPSPRARNPGHVSDSSFTHVNVTVVPSIAIVVLAGSTSAYKSHRHANGVAVAARLDLVPGASQCIESISDESIHRSSRIASRERANAREKITSLGRPRSRRSRTSRRPPRGVIASNRHRWRDLDRHRARGLHPRASVVLARPRTLVVVREGGERSGGIHTGVRRVHRARETVASLSSSSRSDESSRRRRLSCLNPKPYHIDHAMHRRARRQFATPSVVVVGRDGGRDGRGERANRGDARR